MADIAQKRVQLAEFRGRLAQVEQQLQESQRALAQNEDTIPRIERALARAESGDSGQDPARIRADLEQARRASIDLRESIRQEERQIRELQTGIQILDEDIAAAQLGSPAQSTGQTTAEAQQARDEGALPQSPPRANDDAPPAATTATQPGTAPTTGVNGELRPAAQVQSTPPATAASPLPPSASGPQPGAQRGAAAPSDDNTAGLNPVAQELQRLYGSTTEQIRPQPNPLDRCASYTYNITIYLTTPELYSGLITNKRKSVSGMTVLIRSGGTTQSPTLDAVTAQQVADGASAARPGEARNPNFPLDFYIDNLQIKSVINGKGTMNSHSATEIDFRVIEPNGITFIHNLQAATKQLALGTGDLQNAYLSQIYLMAIRFYGWDQNGNPVSPTPDVAAQQSDRTAITEKFIPFIFTGIRFKIANKLTEYDCSAVAVGNMIATGQQRGVIPYNFQITSTTLKGLLQNDLQTALNKYQTDLCQANPAEGRPEPVFTYPDVYEFQLVPPLDGDTITLRPPGDTANTQTAMALPAQKDPRSALPATQSVKSNTKLNSAFAGMSIVQFIDQMVRQSGYIYQQQTYIYDPKTQKSQRQSGSGTLMAWYRITVQAVPDLQKWDPRRRDYAYRITYQVTPYLVTDVLSDYFPKSPRWTAPKEYRYWFTGQNNSILDFTQEFNNLYYFVVNAPQPEFSDSQLKNESKKGYQPNSNISSAGMPGRVNEPGANAAQYLYSPADLARARMTIIGDPDWIQQGDVWAGIDSPTDFDPAAIYAEGPDAGAINYGSRETVFDIVFKTPADYDLNTGLITDPAASTPGPTVNGEPRMLELRTRYKAVTVTNNFSQGRFTQDIEGVMVMPDVSQDDKQTAQKDSEKSLTTVPPGSPALSSTGAATLSGPDLATFRKLEIEQQNASFKATDWNASLKNQLPGSATSPGLISQLDRAVVTPLPLLSSAPTSGTETVGPADAPATANLGESDGVTEQDLFEAEGINRAGGDATPEQVARNRELNRTLTISTLGPQRGSREA